VKKEEADRALLRAPSVRPLGGEARVPGLRRVRIAGRARPREGPAGRVGPYAPLRGGGRASREMVRTRVARHRGPGSRSWSARAPLTASTGGHRPYTRGPHLTTTKGPRRQRHARPRIRGEAARGSQIVEGPEADIALMPRLMDCRYVTGHSASSASDTKGYSAWGGGSRRLRDEEEDGGILQRHQREEDEDYAAGQHS